MSDLRRRAHTPSHGAGAATKARLDANAASNPLVPGTPEYYDESQAQQKAAAQRTKNYAVRAGGAFDRGNTESGYWHAGKALTSLVGADPLRRALRAEDIPVTPYQAPVPPAPYNPVFPSYSGPINRRPEAIVEAPKASTTTYTSMHPEQNLSKKPVPERSTLAKVCSGLTCGLSNYVFGKPKLEGGRRKTYKKKNKESKKSKKRQSRKI